MSVWGRRVVIFFSADLDIGNQEKRGGWLHCFNYWFHHFMGNISQWHGGGSPSGVKDNHRVQQWKFQWRRVKFRFSHPPNYFLLTNEEASMSSGRNYPTPNIWHVLQISLLWWWETIWKLKMGWHCIISLLFEAWMVQGMHPILGPSIRGLIIFYVGFWFYFC